MKKSLLSMLTAVITAWMVTGCTLGTQQQEDGKRNQITQSIEAVDRVTVLATNGQEISLNLAAFSKGLDIHGTAQLSRTEGSLSKSEIRYTLIAYRSSEAPLVMEIGEDAVQYNQVTYRGVGAQQFYGFIRQLAGEALFRSKKPTAVELHADDQYTYKKLTDKENALVLAAMSKAGYEPQPPQVPFPLYPHYRLKLAFADGVADAVIVTPSLLAVTLGNDTLYYQINQELFSQTTEWLPVRPASEVLETLYKASKLSIRSTTDAKLHTTWEADESISKQGAIQQLVRILHQAPEVTVPAEGVGPAAAVLTFWIADTTERRITIYANHFAVDDKLFHRPMIGQNIQNLLSTKEFIQFLHENLKNW
ncbi:hypothetical protein [Brevibacillus dissolubilis]|uniref:hypothetical protein n=1 Tax=Brevibacillus dissolubilis TaxID=1844116 RepID=UPI001116A70D|nr:hypothetical protein [Brevibacillus dissolubilis]